jgi:hypothetical protein
LLVPAVAFFAISIEIDRAGTPRKDGKDYLTTDVDTLKQASVIGRPALSKLAAMPLAMLPSPMNPTCMTFNSFNAKA